jgi:two-component system LytT family response regulator
MADQQIKTIIIDGVENSGKLLLRLIESCCPEIDVVAVCDSLEQASIIIKETTPKLIFIETELPDGSGFDLLQNLPDRNLKVVFVTGNPDHAVKAYRFSATDYLLKPVVREDLIAAVAKVKTELAEPNSLAEIQDFLGQIAENTDLAKTLVVCNPKGFTVLKTDEIIYLEADAYCTNFYLLGNTKISSSRNLKFYGELLPSSNFMRVHHSFIVNLNHVKGYGSHEEILLADNLSCTLSAAHKATFLNYFKHKK